jgi:hypothetical protein
MPLDPAGGVQRREERATASSDVGADRSNTILKQKKIQ